MQKAFTMRIFVPSGDPEGLRLIDRMNWTGLGLAFPRIEWPKIKQRDQFARTGIYILVGYEGESQDDDLPTIYVGQAGSVHDRIDSHIQHKDFWDRGIVFVSTSGGLNSAHVSWLEYALIARATKAKRCHLDNNNEPNEPTLTEAEKADVQSFLEEILQIVPLVGLRVFDLPKPIATSEITTMPEPPSDQRDTVIVPAKPEGFEEVFLGEGCWYAIRISGSMLTKIKHIAAYQIHPISAITHYAPIERIEPYGESGKYKLIFSKPAQKLKEKIPLGNAPMGAMQGPRYTTFDKLTTAKSVNDI